MRHSVARVRGVGYILWQSRHEFYHILLGLMWSWYLREQWQEFNYRWILLAIFGSLLPDLDHLWYFFTYGRKDSYSQEAFRLLREREWRTFVYFLAHGHKNNTNLASHNYYFMAALLLGSLLSSIFTWRVGVILFGAMAIHYFFDIADDLLLLGHVNPNWKRLGRAKRSIFAQKT
jgi:hypothetical protein